MVTFMVKWTVAAIPALIILALFCFGIAVIFGLIGHAVPK
jgi:ABC-type polysaccharide/polyol phosphate export permease